MSNNTCGLVKKNTGIYNNTNNTCLYEIKKSSLLCSYFEEDQLGGRNTFREKLLVLVLG